MDGDRGQSRGRPWGEPADRLQKGGYASVYRGRNPGKCAFHLSSTSKKYVRTMDIHVHMWSACIACSAVHPVRTWLPGRDRWGVSEKHRP